MEVKTYIDRLTMSRAAARQRGPGAARRRSRRAAGARIVAATGASQFDFLDALTATADIDWTRVEMFHLDEYVGLPIDHPASFRRYLLERLIDKTGITRYHLLDGERDAARVADEVGRELRGSADRRGVCRDRRERPPGVQRSAGRFRDRAAVPHRHAGRRRAGGSRSAKAGSPRWRTCRRRRSRCRCARF